MTATRIDCSHLNEWYLTPVDMNNIRRGCSSQIINKRKVHTTILADVTRYLLLRQDIPNILVLIRISVYRTSYLDAEVVVPLDAM